MVNIQVKVKKLDINTKLHINELNGFFKNTSGFSGVYSDGKSPVTSYEKALWNEYGFDPSGVKIPSRPFIRHTVASMVTKRGFSLAVARRFKYLVARYGGVVSGKDFAQKLTSAISFVVAKRIRHSVLRANSWAVPNAPMTVAKKEAEGKDQKVLQDDKDMLKNIGYHVERYGGVVEHKLVDSKGQVL